MSRLNRARVVEAALEILETGGAAALTIPALATKLKIRPPSLYNHIESIFDLRRELSIRSMRLICDVWRKAVEGKSGDPAILAATSAYRQFALENPALYALSVAVPPTGDAEWSEAFAEFPRLWMQVLGTHRLETLSTRHISRALRSLVHGFVDLEVNGGWLEDVPSETSFSASIELFLRGLQAMKEAKD